MLTDKRAERILANMKPLGEMLEEWRETLHLTPAEAARRCKMSAQHYWQIEHGQVPNPRRSTLEKLTEGTGIPIERLAAAIYAAPVPA